MPFFSQGSLAKGPCWNLHAFQILKEMERTQEPHLRADILRAGNAPE